jgi:hypothetical protein
MMEIKIEPKKTAFFFLSIVGFLVVMQCLTLYLFFHTDSEKVIYLFRWFDLDIEQNIPSFYSAFAILISSLLFSVIAFFEKNISRGRALRWCGLALVFLFLSIDEAFELHESIGDITENYINATGLLYFPWVIPYSFMTLVFASLYFRFLLRLPKKTARLLFLSGTIYITGAIFLDMLGGREAELHGLDSVIYCLLYTVEESFEMLAIVLLIYTLLAYIEKQFGYIYISLHVRDERKSTSANGSLGGVVGQSQGGEGNHE